MCLGLEMRLVTERWVCRRMVLAHDVCQAMGLHRLAERLFEGVVDDLECAIKVIVTMCD